MDPEIIDQTGSDLSAEAVDEMAKYGIIPIGLDIDRCPLAGADGANAVWIGDQPVPCGFAGFDYSLVAVPDS